MKYQVIVTRHLNNGLTVVAIDIPAEPAITPADPWLTFLLEIARKVRRSLDL